MIEILFVLFAIPILAMEHTPPLQIPEHLKDRIEVLPSTYGSTDVRRTTSTHHVHDTDTFTRTTKNDAGKDVVIEIKEDRVHDSDNDKEIQISKKILILSHGATVIITALISAGTTVGIAYAKCHG